MKPKKTDYVPERTFGGGYHARLSVNMQCNAYGDSLRIKFLLANGVME